MNMTYRKLLINLSNMTDDQLDQEIKVLAETSNFKVGGLLILEEDHINPTGECMEPVSDYPSYVDEIVVAKKGDVYLVEE